ncbi:MAG: hypothetical protein GXO36_06050 [Chloroflexi bacterium]|nr:hypothetical protein [Chloroflexota bacterium]
MSTPTTPLPPPFSPDPTMKRRTWVRWALEYGSALVLFLILAAAALSRRPWVGRGPLAGLFTVLVVFGLPLAALWVMRQARLGARRLAAFVQTDLFELDEALAADAKRYRKARDEDEDEGQDAALKTEHEALQAQAWAVFLSEAFLDAQAFGNARDPWIMAFPFANWDLKKKKWQILVPAWVRNLGGPLLAYLDPNLAAVVEPLVSRDEAQARVVLPLVESYRVLSTADLPAPSVSVRCVHQPSPLAEMEIPGLPRPVPREACRSRWLCTCAREYELNFHLNPFERVRYFLLWRPEYPPLRLKNLRLYTQDGVPVLIRHVEVRYRLYGDETRPKAIENSVSHMIRREPANRSEFSVVELARFVTEEDVHQAFRRVIVRYTVSNLFNRLHWSVVDEYLEQLSPDLREHFLANLKTRWQTVTLEELREALLRELNGPDNKKAQARGTYIESVVFSEPLPPKRLAGNVREFFFPHNRFSQRWRSPDFLDSMFWTGVQSAWRDILEEIALYEERTLGPGFTLLEVQAYLRGLYRLTWNLLLRLSDHFPRQQPDGAKGESLRVCPEIPDPDHATQEDWARMLLALLSAMVPLWNVLTPGQVPLPSSHPDDWLYG